MSTLKITSATLGAALAMTVSSQAVLIASDAFHTTTGDSSGGTYFTNGAASLALINQNPSVDVFGFVNQWRNSNSVFTGNFQVSPTLGLSHGLIGGQTAPGGVFGVGNSSAARAMFRQVDFSASGASATAESDYYFSFALSSAGPMIAGLGLSQQGSQSASVTDALGGVRVGFNGSNLGMWVNGEATNILSDFTANETYFAVAHIVNNGVGTNDVVTVDIYGGAATFGDLGDPLATATVSNQDVTGNLAWLGFIMSSPDVQSQTFFDEFRFGTTLESVVVPEPGSITLLGLGGLALLARRRSRA